MSAKYPDVGCKRGFFVDTDSVRVPRGRICLFRGFGTPTEPDRTMSAFLVAVADSVEELRERHPEAFERHTVGDVPVENINAALAFRAERPERCPICGGLNPGDISHTRCASSGYEGL